MVIEQHEGDIKVVPEQHAENQKQFVIKQKPTAPKPSFVVTQSSKNQLRLNPPTTK